MRSMDIGYTVDVKVSVSLGSHIQVQSGSTTHGLINMGDEPSERDQGRKLYTCWRNEVVN